MMSPLQKKESKRQVFSNYSVFALRMHADVDNEEGSTICRYKSMPYKMHGVMHNLCSVKTIQRILTR